MRFFLRLLAISFVVFIFGTYSCISEGFRGGNLEMAGAGLLGTFVFGGLSYYFSDAE